MNIIASVRILSAALIGACFMLAVSPAAAQAAYDVAQLNPVVRDSVVQARAAEARAVSAAARARDAQRDAQQAGVHDPRDGLGISTWDNGDVYAGQFAGGVKSGVGVYLWSASAP